MTKKHSKNKYTVSCSKTIKDNNNNIVYENDDVSGDVDAAAVDVAVQGKFTNKTFRKVKVKQMTYHLQ